MQVAPTEMSVLITGESGSGKESFSKIIHALSSRKHGPFIAINCGAIPEGTIDSEFFGHIKGSFTGAIDDRKGYFEITNSGTIFLDEVAEMPLATQARLLRVEAGERLPAQPQGCRTLLSGLRAEYERRPGERPSRSTSRARIRSPTPATRSSTRSSNSCRMRWTQAIVFFALLAGSTVNTWSYLFLK